MGSTSDSFILGPFLPTTSPYIGNCLVSRWTASLKRSTRSDRNISGTLDVGVSAGSLATTSKRVDAVHSGPEI